MAIEEPHHKVLRAIDAWYEINWQSGTRLTGVERESLAKYVAQRLGQHTTSARPETPVANTTQGQP